MSTSAGCLRLTESPYQIISSGLLESRTRRGISHRRCPDVNDHV